MFGLFDKLTEFIKETLIDSVLDSLASMFTDVNESVGIIAEEVGKTPAGWNGSIFSMIKTLSDDVVVPVAGLILTFVVCYELITLIVEKNNLHDLDTWIFFKWFFKTFVAVYLLTNTFDIVMAVFDVGQHMVNNAAGSITSATALNMDSVLATIETNLQNYSIGSLMGLAVEIAIVKIVTNGLAVAITVILYGRMMEIYLVTSLAPIPFATMTNKEWGNIGTNYIKSIFALAVQGFFIMVCVGIYAALVNTVSITEDIHYSIWTILGYTVLLVFSLFKTGSIAKSVLNAH